MNGQTGKSGKQRKQNRRKKVEKDRLPKKEVTSLSIKKERTKKGRFKSDIGKQIEKEQPAGPRIASSGSLVNKLRTNLKGSRFRYLNEQLYKASGSDGLSLFQHKPSEFEAYHEGYRHQVEQWPMNPLRKIIGEIKKL